MIVILLITILPKKVGVKVATICKVASTLEEDMVKVVLHSKTVCLVLEIGLDQTITAS